MSSRFSSSGGGGPLPIGKVLGFRGRGGEITVRVPSGRPERWTGVRAVFVARHEADPPEVCPSYEVESSRAYSDRLVLKLRGIDDARAAAELKGAIILAPREAVPTLPPGEYYVARLIGLEVRDERGCPMGRVKDVWETGGADLVVIAAQDGSEWLLPLAEQLVLSISEEEGIMIVRPPEGLAEGQKS